LPVSVSGYRPVALSKKSFGALRVAHWLAGAARSGNGGLHDADFWFANAEKLIAPLLLAANLEKATMERVVAWIDEGPEACEAKVAPIHAVAGEERAARAFMATQNREERRRSSVYTTAETILSAFSDPRVAEETAGSDYTPEGLLSAANTLFLISPASEQERLRTVFSTVMLALVEERSTASGLPIDPYLLLLLDECANVAPFPGLAQTASTGAGQGIQLLTVFQDLAQVKASFGPSAPTILNNHRAMLLGRGGFGRRDARALLPTDRLGGVRAALDPHPERGTRSALTDRGRHLSRACPGAPAAAEQGGGGAAGVREPAVDDDRTAAVVSGHATE
jgi:type IV secretion system protein VirD4